jgi:hypothetical protein
MIRTTLPSRRYFNSRRHDGLKHSEIIGHGTVFGAIAKQNCIDARLVECVACLQRKRYYRFSAKTKTPCKVCQDKVQTGTWHIRKTISRPTELRHTRDIQHRQAAAKPVKRRQRWFEARVGSESSQPILTPGLLHYDLALVVPSWQPPLRPALRGTEWRR